MLDSVYGEKIKRLQEGFSRVTGLCAYCMDGDGQRITEISGPPERIRSAREYADSPQLRSVLDRVEHGSIEDQAAELLNENGDRVAALAVRDGGKTLVCWVIFSLGRPKARSEEELWQVVDLLRESSMALFAGGGPDAEEDGAGEARSGGETERTLRTVEATTRIVGLLDSDEPVGVVTRRWLEILAKHLDVDTALLFGLDRERQSKDIVCEWLAPGMLSYFDRIRNLQLEPWLLTDRPKALSYDAPDNEYWRTLKGMGIKACMIFPVIRKDREIVLSLNHRRRKHKWDAQELRFAADAVRVLQSILIKGIQDSSLESSHETLGTVLDNVACGIYVTDRQTGEPLFVNRRLKGIFERELREKTFEKLLRQGMDEEANGGKTEICYRAREQWYDLSSRRIAWIDGRDAVLYSLYDITDKKLYQRRIEQQARTDFLTGLYNRMCCERDLARQIDEAKKTGTVGALLFLDLDDFKHINDGLGHQYGDALLKSISHELQRVRGIERTCYRMGGDEFVIIIPTQEYADAERIVRDIRTIFSRPWFLKDADYYCTMSMGVVTYPDLGDSVTDLIRRADIAMYEAKKGGKNRVSYYSEKLRSHSGRRLDMEKNMRDATADGYSEFEVYYQPIIDVQDGREKCAGAEALIRWNSAKLGFVPPYEFIPLAEYLGLINPIGNHVLREACRSCKRWNDNGYPDYKVSVNLSVVQLLQADVVETVERVLDETQIAPRNLTLEVTESLAINDMERMKQILGRIKALGVKIALDDFGTGYSSLNHIREIPFDIIKVDQSFVKELAADAYSQSFVRMVAELARTLGVNICVEGIETLAQYRVVRRMQVKYIQGYYFDRPMKRADFEEKYCKEENDAAAESGTEE